MNNGKPATNLSDVGLVGVDGVQALRQIRGQPQFKIIIQTVSDDSQKVVWSICVGASSYHLKTTKFSKLAEVIREALDGASMTSRRARRVSEFIPAMAQETKSGVVVLTERERKILRLMTDGLTKKEIGAQLEISTNTVSTHVRSIYEKLQITTNTGAVAKALRERLI